MKIVWCVTGASHLLPEAAAALEKVAGKNAVTLACSKAGVEVSKSFGLYGRITKAAEETVLESDQGASAPFCMKLGGYDLIVIAPCTANTAAKIACGIADSLASNIAAQGLKIGKRVVVLPTDAVGNIESKTQSGGKIRITCRDVDMENAGKLKAAGIAVAETAAQLEDCLRGCGCLP